MAQVNTVVVREPNGALTVSVDGHAINGVAHVQMLGSDGTGSITIVLPLANVQFAERPMANNVIPFPHSS